VGSRRWGRTPNPGLKLANAFGVNSKLHRYVGPEDGLIIFNGQIGTFDRILVN
jgi:hypothetical protein